MDDDVWYFAERKGRKGLIPSNYVAMTDNSWYRKNISRLDAEKYLSQEYSTNGRPDGIFLIRDSESDSEKFSLTVIHSNQCYHFKILSDAEGNYYLWTSKKFNSINKLIDHYHQSTISSELNVKIILKDNVKKKSSKGGDKVIYVAKHDYHPDSNDKLPLKCGDRIKLLEKTEEHWWTGQVVGCKRKGLFPYNYVKKEK